MKKIGIITFHASHNCGSFMQSYALQKYLKKKGFEVETINFSNEGQRKLYSITYKNNSLKNILKNIILFPRRKILKETYKNYTEFIHKHLKLSKDEFSTLEQLDNYLFDYDIFICGSDQIWNITIEDFDDAYFLPFVKDKKKIAYAPSFGSKKLSKYIDSKELEKYTRYLQEFSLVTVREANGQKWLKELNNIDASIVLDPTLLLNREDYKEIEEDYDKEISGKYIFYYSPSYNPQINALVKKISKKYDLKVIAWNPKSYYLKFMNFKGLYLPKRQNPGVYLSLIRDAEIVITTSFHGTIFSTIYGKKFWVIKNGDMYGDDDRVKTLIEQLNITDRLISMEFDETFDYVKKVNYSLYDEKLPLLQEKSESLLLKGVNDDKD